MSKEKSTSSYPETKTSIIGGGIIGALETYFIYLNDLANKQKSRVTIYEKNKSINDTTAYNISASLTNVEIQGIVPVGDEMNQAMSIPFNEKGGIRVDDVKDANSSEAAEAFFRAAKAYSRDEQAHSFRTNILFELGKMSMDLWSSIYENGDSDLKKIMEESNFSPCRETTKDELHDGYRVDLVYRQNNALNIASKMTDDYKSLGFKQSRVLTTDEVRKLDPYLSEFCDDYSKEDGNWQDSAAAIWRPGGCIDTTKFLPKLYEYLSKNMGTYVNEEGKEKPCFQLKFNREVTAVSVEENLVTSVSFADRVKSSKHRYKTSNYVLSPGEATGTLSRFGFKEPASARFAGASLKLAIEVPKDRLEEFSKLNHCMEVHQKGVVLAWQARFIDGKVYIGVAGTKAFYGDKIPHKDEAFCKNRNLLQLNMINDVLPELISLALGKDTRRQTLTEDDLKTLEDKQIAKRWVGSRTVPYDGVPVLGSLYQNGSTTALQNARVTTGLGSGGVSFGPAAVSVSRNATGGDVNKSFVERVLEVANSARSVG